jgi:hypothetical protein
MMASLGGCLVVILFSWPESDGPRQREAYRDPPIAVGRSVIDGGIFPIRHETGSITTVKTTP